MSNKKYFVDLPMLDRFTLYHRERLKVYAHMLDAISDARQVLFCDHDERRSLEGAEIKVDEIASILIDSGGFDREDDEYLMVNSFLNGLHCGIKRKPIHYREFPTRNHHSLVEAVIFCAACDWRDLRHKCYNTTKSATELSPKKILWDLPGHNTLYALLAAEYAKAREILLAQPEMPQ